MDAGPGKVARSDEGEVDIGDRAELADKRESTSSSETVDVATGDLEPFDLG
jgi:hypothetical protein